MDFDAWQTGIREILHIEGSPITHRSGHWHIENRANLFESIGSRIFDKNLEVLLEAALKVLKETHPRYDLSSDRWLTSSIFGKTHKYSDQLRAGIAESLALVSIFGKSLRNCSIGKPESIVDSAVQRVLGDADWKLWASLNRLLPTLAEASPNKYLEAVESAMSRSPNPFTELFDQEGHGETLISGLLWGLEITAWFPEFYSRTIRILGDLAAIDPGGNWSNRPSNSIVTILLPWLPRTDAPESVRLASLRMLCNDHPNVGWDILVRLLPKSHQISTGTHKPRWRAISPDEERHLSVAKYREIVTSYGELLLETAKQSPERLAELASNAENLPDSILLNFTTFLESMPNDRISEAERSRIWESLSDLVAKHRSYEDADWALPKQTIDLIALTADKLSPSSLRLRSKPLFSEARNYYRPIAQDWQATMEAKAKARLDAIIRIVESEGLDGLLEFIRIVDSPNMVGDTLGHLNNDGLIAALIPAYLKTTEESISQFVRQFIRSRSLIRGLSWLRDLKISSWDHDSKVRVLINLPFEMDTWLLVDELLGSKSNEYWIEVNPTVYSIRGEIEPAVDRLLIVGRSSYAIEALYALYTYRRVFNAGKVASALISHLDNQDPRSIDPHALQELIRGLQESSDVKPDDLSKIEWGYLRILDQFSPVKPLSLWRRLADSPEFFCELIQLVYRPDKQRKRKSKPANLTEKQRTALVENAWWLMHEWRMPPGTIAPNGYSAENAKRWFEAVRTITTESGHLDIAMNQLGHALFYAPPDPDGLWIHRGAASLIDSKGAEKVAEGFVTEAYNSRGAHIVDPTGAGERQLADLWKDRSQRLESSGFVRFASHLIGLSKTYLRESELVRERHDR